MRFSQHFIPTVREVPAEATITSHILMIRAALIRPLVSGVYSYLPLGYRALRKAEEIVRQEMDKVGGIEVHLPVLVPVELFRQTNRVEAFGNILFKFKDQHNTELSLGPTHEEIITKLVADHLNSYKQLPINFYQIQTKFRDEERPKSGVLRTREFVMKDAYSFHASLEDLDKTYERMYAAYENIFKRCGLPVIAVEAESGPIGGSASHEFMMLTDVGEDQVVICDNCKYAANVERATRKVPSYDLSGLAVDTKTPERKEVLTPNQKTIDDLCNFLKCKAEQTIKTLIYRAGDQVIAALVRGDHEVNEVKLRSAVGVKGLELADDATIKKLTGAQTGFAGPVGLKPDKMIIDYDVLSITNGVTGANKTDYHFMGVVPGRDFTINETMLADIRNVVSDDLCPHCHQKLRFARAIEVGHVFKLGTKYSSVLGAKYLDAEGKNHDMIMGCYGIGVNRILAAAIEAHHDENGIVWPISISPYQVNLLSLSLTDEKVRTTAEKLHDELEAAGIDVLLDDRDARPGVKFKDADLLGFPIRVTIGPKTLAEGKVELKLRDQKEVQLIEVEKASDIIRDLVAQLMRKLNS
ncbi:MAG: proline--tRNA ligase [Phycisphaerae bacterium]